MPPRRKKGGSAEDREPCPRKKSRKEETNNPNPNPEHSSPAGKLKMKMTQRRRESDTNKKAEEIDIRSKYFCEENATSAKRPRRKIESKNSIQMKSSSANEKRKTANSQNDLLAKMTKQKSSDVRRANPKASSKSSLASGDLSKKSKKETTSDRKMRKTDPNCKKSKKDCNRKTRKKLTTEEKVEKGDSSDSESEEWEEVEELPRDDDDEEEKWKSQVPEKPVEITIESNDLLGKKRRKTEFDLKDYFRRQLNRFRTETQGNAHKVHLLCLLSHGLFKNRMCSDETLKAVAFSVVPLEFTKKPTEKWILRDFVNLNRWFKKTFAIDENLHEVHDPLFQMILTRFSDQKVQSEHEHILLFAITCRGIGLQTRLIYSFQPIPSKPTDLKRNKLFHASKECVKKKNAPLPRKEKSSKSTGGKSNTKKPRLENSKTDESRSSVPDEDSQSGAEEKRPGDLLRPRNRRPRRSGSKVNYSEEMEEGEDDVDELTISAENEDDSDNSEEKKKKKTMKTQQNRKKSTALSESNSSDDDFEEKKKSFRHLYTSSSSSTSSSRKRAANRKTSKNLQKISDEDRFVIVSKPFGSDWWIEVYLEEEKRWIYADSVRLQVDHPEDAEKHASKPLSYILAFDDGQYVKDVTKKYSSDCMSSVRKRRLDDVWWRNVLTPLRNVRDFQKDDAEDSLIHEQLLKKPLPTSISDFKNNALYVLKRHLLKYEAIYPTTSLVLGHVRGEPVYARECVQMLHSKEKWRLDGRCVRIDEEAYKIVRARPKWNKPKEFNDQLKLNLFGKWQTEQFVPPPAVEGKIPRNEYGNVEVFQPWMIPGGTVHLPDSLSGLNRVAKKLEIDCAQAMVGWEFHGGFNHPILKGWIVCEEHRDILLVAWEEEKAIQMQKEAEKRQERILNNWKILIKGLFIRERLKSRFNLQEPTAKKTGKKDENLDRIANDDDDDEEVKVTETKSWPENLKKNNCWRELRSHELLKDGSGGRKAGTSKETCNLFPFEKDQQ